MLGEMKCRGQVKTLLASVVTDFNIHPIWISKGIDLYFIHSSDLAAPLIQEGIAAEKIKPIGIPIRMQFTVSQDACSYKAVFLSGSPVVLVMGGGLGLGKWAIAKNCLVRRSLV